MTSGRDVMMEKWNEDKIMNLSREIDDFFVEKALKYEMSANAINGVFMARLLRMNMSVDNMEGLKKLLESILAEEYKSVDNHPIH